MLVAKPFQCQPFQGQSFQGYCFQGYTFTIHTSMFYPGYFGTIKTRACPQGYQYSQHDFNQ